MNIIRKKFILDRLSLAETLMNMLSLNIAFEQRDLLIKAVDLFKNSSLSLEDCYNLAYAKTGNVEDFKTFDQVPPNLFDPFLAP